MPKRFRRQSAARRFARSGTLKNAEASRAEAERRRKRLRARPSSYRGGGKRAAASVSAEKASARGGRARGAERSMFKREKGARSERGQYVQCRTTSSLVGLKRRRMSSEEGEFYRQPPSANQKAACLLECTPVVARAPPVLLGEPRFTSRYTVPDGV